MEISKNEYDIAVGIFADIRSGKRPTTKAIKKIHPEWNESYCRTIISLAKMLEMHCKHYETPTNNRKIINEQ